MCTLESFLFDRSLENKGHWADYLSFAGQRNRKKKFGANLSTFDRPEVCWQCMETDFQNFQTSIKYETP